MDIKQVASSQDKISRGMSEEVPCTCSTLVFFQLTRIFRGSHFAPEGPRFIRS